MMRLLLIRHGETVDNVAGLYAGSRDSALTAHGVLQARRLASHLVARSPQTFLASSVFSSDLQRAVKTAAIVCESQNRARRVQRDNPDKGSNDLVVLPLPELREKHFGSGEGTKFGTGRSEPHHGAETGEDMMRRVDRFLDNHLIPMIQNDETSSSIVVAHGIILGVIFKAICARALPSLLTVSSEAQRSAPGYSSGNGPPVLPAWTNTGYLEVVLSMATLQFPKVDAASSNDNLPPGMDQKRNLKVHVEKVNYTDHLKGLKKTRGGIGSAQFDEKQKTIHSFFTTSATKRKVEDDTTETDKKRAH